MDVHKGDFVVVQRPARHSVGAVPITGGMENRQVVVRGASGRNSLVVRVMRRRLYAASRTLLKMNRSKRRLPVSGSRVG
jgi:hypothetical protein